MSKDPGGTPVGSCEVCPALEEPGTRDAGCFPRGADAKLSPLTSCPPGVDED